MVIFLATIVILAITPAAMKALAAGQQLRLEDPVLTRLLMTAMLVVQIVGTGLVVWLASWKLGRISDVLALRAPAGGWKAYAWAVPAFVGFGLGLGNTLPQRNHKTQSGAIRLS